MGVFACAWSKYGFTARGDGPVRYSIHPARKRPTGRQLRWEIAPVTLPGKAGRHGDPFDEQPFKGPSVQDPRPEAGVQKGTITAATSSSISDGAAALVLMRESTAAKRWALQPSRASSRTPCMRRRRMVHHRAGGRDRQGARRRPAGAPGRGSVGGQRGLRGGDDGRDGRVRLPHEIVNMARRRPRWGIRSAPRARASSSRCSAPCASGQKKGVASPVHRWRRGTTRWPSSFSDVAGMPSSSAPRSGISAGVRAGAFNATCRGWRGGHVAGARWRPRRAEVAGAPPSRST